MYFSKKLFTKTVALAAICASIATASFAAPQGTYDTSEIHVTGQASRSVAPSYAILTLGITSENTNINAAKSNNDRIMSVLLRKIFIHLIFLLILLAITKMVNALIRVIVCPTM